MPIGHGHKEEATAAAHAKYDEINRKQQTSSMTILGNPDITAEGKIEIGDLHSEMNGEYIVKNATHSLSSGGYQTTMELYKEPTG